MSLTGRLIAFFGRFGLPIAGLLALAAVVPCGSAAGLPQHAAPGAAREVGGRFAPIVGVLRGWEPIARSPSLGACADPVSTPSLAGIAREFDFPTARSARAQIDVGVVLHPTASVARRVIEQAVAPSGIACVRASIARINKRALHRSVHVISSEGLPVWLRSRARFLHAFTMRWAIAGAEVFSMHVLFEDRRDPRVVYALSVTEYAQIPRALMLRLIAAANS